MKKILLISNDLKTWGQKYLLETLSQNYEVNTILLSSVIQSYGSEFNIKYQERKSIFRFEKFLRFFVIPPSTNNYKYGKKRNILSSKNIPLKKLLLFIEKYFPKLLNENIIDKILGIIPGSIDNVLDDLQPDLIINIAFLSPYNYPTCRARRRGFKTASLIYSWDNPFKDSFLPKSFGKYFVWSSEMAQDINHLHDIPVEKCEKIGALQFDYLQKLEEGSLNYAVGKFIRENKNEYYLYAFSCSYNAVQQEIDLFIEIAKILWEVNPARKILARPYPYATNPEFYDSINKLDNVYVQDIFHPDKGLITESDYDKKVVLENSFCVINYGSTLALEAAILNKLIIQINFLPTIFQESNRRERVMDIDYILKNDHLFKYFHVNYPNAVDKASDLKIVFREIEDGSLSKYWDFTKYLKKLCGHSNNSFASTIFLRRIEEII